MAIANKVAVVATAIVTSPTRMSEAPLPEPELDAFPVADVPDPLLVLDDPAPLDEDDADTATGSLLTTFQAAFALAEAEVGS